MGTIQHHAIIVTGSDYGEGVQRCHAYAKEIFPWVSEISPVAMNGYRSFFIPPDGSKEGWHDSDVGDSRREKFEAFMTGNRVGWCVEVQYGEIGESIREFW